MVYIYKPVKSRTNTTRVHNWKGARSTNTFGLLTLSIYLIGDVLIHKRTCIRIWKRVVKFIRSYMIIFSTEHSRVQDSALLCTLVSIIISQIIVLPLNCRKTERKITFEQFQDALKLVAEKKYPGDPSAVKKLTAKLTSGSKGPVTAGATVSRR